MDQGHRPQVITGNWKMYKTLDEALTFVRDLLPSIQGIRSTVYLAVPYTLLLPLSKEVGETSLFVGAQNMNDASEGAFTGEIAGKMIKDAGGKFVLLGHSERRRLFHEDNAFINRKVKRAISDQLQPILCIGETKKEREEEQTKEVIRTQLCEGLAGIEPQSLSDLIVAYEPVWAIGAHESATAEVVQEAHRFCREVLSELLSQPLADQIVIQYGGAVTPSNATELLMQSDVDGLLIGGASLSLESFVKIIHDSNQLNP